MPTIDATIAAGQRVGVAWNRDFCGSCAFCTTLSQDGETRCALKPHSGQYADGTFAQYTLVPARFLLRIPEGYADIRDELVAPILCGGVTAYKALKSCTDLYPGQWIAVSGGGGGVGAFVVAFGKAMGYRVIAVDAGVDKGTYATEEGAEHYVDITNPEVINGGGVGAEVKKLTGGAGVAAAIVCAGVGPAYQSALDMLAPFGTLMCVGIPPPHGTFTIHPLQFIADGFKIMGSAVGTRRDTIEALEFVKRGLVRPKVQWAALSSMPTLMDDVMKGKVRLDFRCSMCMNFLGLISLTAYSGAREIRDQPGRGIIKAVPAY